MPYRFCGPWLPALSGRRRKATQRAGRIGRIWLCPSNGGHGAERVTRPPAERVRNRTENWPCRSDPVPTTLKAVVERYLRAKTLSQGTRNEYFSTLRKWE